MDNLGHKTIDVRGWFDGRNDRRTWRIKTEFCSLEKKETMEMLGFCAFEVSQVKLCCVYIVLRVKNDWRVGFFYKKKILLQSYYVTTVVTSYENNIIFL